MCYAEMPQIIAYRFTGKFSVQETNELLMQEKLRELAKLYGQYSIHALCEALCVSRGTFYNHIFRKKEVTAYDKRRAEMKEHIKAAFDKSQQRFGANKIAAALSAQEISTSPKYVRDLMQEVGLQSITRYSKRDYQKGKRLAKKRNLLQRQFQANEPNRVWVSDVTCFKINDKYLYVCEILDLFSRKVVAYRVSSKKSTYLITSTFTSLDKGIQPIVKCDGSLKVRFSTQ